MRCLLLLLSHDVEPNSGPDKEEVLSTVLGTVQMLEAGQASIQDNLQTLKPRQASVDVGLKQLYARFREA